MNKVNVVVVMPASVHGHDMSPGMRRRMSRGRVTSTAPEQEMLRTVLAIFGAPQPGNGLAALRYWGQSGARPTDWMAAADPVHLQARMRDLRIRALPASHYAQEELQRLFATFQAELGTGKSYAFAELSGCGYLRAQAPLELPVMSAEIAEGHVPDRFTPAGATAKNFHQLLGEVQMLLHAHSVNQERQQTGLPEINSLWFWGGGVAPQPQEHRLPVLYGDDPLFRGYWASCGQTAMSWGNFDQGIIRKAGCIVAVVPEAEAPGTDLSKLEAQLLQGRPKHLTLLFRDGLTIEIKQQHHWRFWRGISPLLESGANE